MPAGVYLHIPFCRSRCSYCDFATDVYRDSGAVERYVAALCREVDHSTAGPSASVDTIYFGGGTPSLLSPEQVDRLIEAVRKKYTLTENLEVTMEMNPATVSPETLTAFRRIGINRASFGLQTFDDRALKTLARGHTADDARDTFRMLRDAGFENVSFDLIAGLPGQTMDDWCRNLNEAISMRPEHLSLYLLEIHDGTPLAEQVRSGRQPKPDDDLSAEMYEEMCDTLDRAGYAQYEISNFARKGSESRHNTKYWRLDAVYGFGVSAHSFDGVERYSNCRDTAEYVRLIESCGTAEVSREVIDTSAEYVFLGLRMTDGIDLGKYAERFGTDLMRSKGHEIDELTAAGLIVIENDRVRLTRRGKLLSNEVFARFI